MRRTRRVLAIALAALGVAAAPATAADFWREPDGGPSPINVSGDVGLANGQPNIAGVDIVDNGGVPWVAWSEWNGTAYLVRVARLEGNEWVTIGSALNANPTRDATQPSLSVNEGIVWATWLESTPGSATEPPSRIIRVARRTGGGWQHIGGAVDLYPAEPSGFAGQSQLAFLNGVAHLGVMEDGGTDYLFDLLKLNANEEWVKADTGTRPHFLTPRSFELEISGGRLYYGDVEVSGGSAVWRLATNGRDWENVGPPNADAGPFQSDIEDFGGNHLAATNLDQAWLLGSDGTWSPLSQPQEGVLGEGFATPHLLTGGVQNADLGAMRLVADVWQPHGSGQIDNREQHRFGQLAEVGPTPYVAWSEFDGCNWEVRVARLQTATADDPPLPAAGACPPPQQPPGGNPNPSPNPNPGPDPPNPNPGPDPPTGVCGIQLFGTQSADSLAGDNRPNEVAGLGGNDRIFGVGHADCLFGGVGNDMLDGGAGNDALHGEAGHDRLKGGDDSDALDGGIGNDRLSGGGDEDDLLGGSGNDVLAGNDGYDTVSAGSGHDVIDARGAGFDRIDCGPGRDRVKNATRRSDRLRGCERVKYGG